MPIPSLYARVKSGRVKVSNFSPPEHRFWSRVDKDGPLHPVLKTRCWLWVGAHGTEGYGYFRETRGRQVKAHRYSWSLVHGPIPDNVLVCHRCDNPPCVNPQHHFLGTHADNKKDSCDKNRHTGNPGQENGKALFSNEEVIAIRRRYRPRHKTHGIRAIARELGVHPMTIYYMVNLKTYKDAIPTKS